jgi:NADH-quinone oxidoreductase subunit N
LNLSLLSTELLTLGLALVIFLADLFQPNQGSRRSLGVLSAVGYLAILVWTFAMPVSGSESTFNGMFLQDGISQTFRQIFLGAAFLTALASTDYLEKTGLRWQGEYYVLLALATAGMMFLASAGDFLSLYIALETMTLAFYVLTAMHKGASKVSSEAGLKYLLLGAFSSAVLLYGISLFYGMTGSTSLETIGSWLAGQQGPVPPLLTMAMLFVLAGFAFKITLVPFHMWAPDVYQGAPTPITGLLSVGSKAAGFAAVIRIFLVAFNHGGISQMWSFALAALASITFLIANLIALKQHNIKRLLAYSSISQAGYLILGVLANSGLGKSALLFYLIVYVFTNLAAFTVVTIVCTRMGSEEIEDFKGLAQTSPLLALVMMLSLLSLAGIPPMAGFFGKFYLFAAGIQAKWFGLVTWAVVNSIVSLFYYLVVVKKMYLENPLPNAPRFTAQSGSLKLALIVCTFFVLFLGVYPAPVLGWLSGVLK